jgi:dissimilatory sulfite reductase (desulfoviridin) alpha/beta subunit
MLEFVHKLQNEKSFALSFCENILERWSNGHKENETPLAELIQKTNLVKYLESILDNLDFSQMEYTDKYVLLTMLLYVCKDNQTVQESIKAVLL